MVRIAWKEKTDTYGHGGGVDSGSERVRRLTNPLSKTTTKETIKLDKIVKNSHFRVLEMHQKETTN